MPNPRSPFRPFIHRPTISFTKPSNQTPTTLSDHLQKGHVIRIIPHSITNVTLRLGANGARPFAGFTFNGPPPIIVACLAGAAAGFTSLARISPSRCVIAVVARRVEDGGVAAVDMMGHSEI